MSSQKKNSNERGIALIAFAAMAVGVVPIVGLSIDVGTLYTVKTKLSAAVDAGALAGAKALAEGADPGTQTTNAQTIAREYVQANFPVGYMATSNLIIPTPTVDTGVGNRRTVIVSASAEAPLYFLHWFSSNNVVVQASATTVRRDVNVSLVVDRSGSLQASGSCGALKAAAAGFVDKFAEARDNVGLVTFASSAFVDFVIGNNFKSASPSVNDLLSGLVCNGATSSAMGLWEGYRQLAALNQPNALNVILFFTDGQPTGVTAEYEIAATSTCADKTPKLGVFNVATGLNATGGLMKHSVSAQPLASDLVQIADGAGCAFSAAWPGTLWLGHLDVSFIPLIDYYGNNLDSGYVAINSRRNGGIDPSNPLSVSAAAVNGADNAALRIRRGDSAGAGLGSVPNVTIFTLGLGTSGIAGADSLLNRVSNTPASSSFDVSYATGLYVVAPTAADLADAFNRIASEIVRLSE